MADGNRLFKVWAHLPGGSGSLRQSRLVDAATGMNAVRNQDLAPESAAMAAQQAQAQHDAGGRDLDRPFSGAPAQTYGSFGRRYYALTRRRAARARCRRSDAGRLRNVGRARWATPAVRAGDSARRGSYIPARDSPCRGSLRPKTVGIVRVDRGQQPGAAGGRRERLHDGDEIHLRLRIGQHQVHAQPAGWRQALAWGQHHHGRLLVRVSVMRGPLSGAWPKPSLRAKREGNGQHGPA